MKLRRAVVALAAVTAAGVVLAGCSAPTGSEISEKTSLSIASNSAVTSLNPLVANQYSTYNSNVAYMYQGVAFNYYNATPKLVKNTDFGTYKKISSDPLKIQYTLSDNAKWSDGDPINAADVLLQWASSITKYNNPKSGANFSSINAGSGLDGITQVPKISNGGKTVTVTFDKPYVDWEVALLAPDLPAHIVYQEAFPNKKISNADADKAVIKAIQNNDTSTIEALAKAWSTKWNVTSMPSDKKLLVSSGPYQVSSFVKNQYITLTKNPNYKAGPIPKVDSITVRFITDPTAQIQALQNGEVDIVYGQPTTDTLGALKKSKGVKYTQTSSASYEHVDLVNNNNGPFSPKSYGGDATKALEVREAFMKVIPREEILDKLIKPLNPNATLDNSSMFLPGAAGYDESVAQNGSSAYEKVDVAGAKALLAKAGVTNPTVRLAYPNDNPRRVSEFQLIQASAEQAGFKVVDAGSPGDDFFTNLPDNGRYDASIFAWQYTSLAYTGNQAAFQTGGSSNYQGYSNKDVDSLWNQLEYSTGSASDNNKLLAQIDKHVWNDADSDILYQFPDLTAWSDKVANVKDNPINVTVFWNFWDWTSQHQTKSTSSK
ncbi:ABC transporter family substrate-binding protein [Humibacter ginsenosidimutans]|uniref:ABC transporter family substrate-binding protein n=1 Tax=Humibacter ginsenosidimutans TaxID=2599293 RepID=A0A5B8M208_9MICO|nr:ABC transporter family substrate-binding protein [Humibacter ginsenosidimutans]QDZ14383.1 ABC transporter family substrate-binding protein [Humibacter ginsenosidimutans]